jgi:LysR family transcriptional regulator, low CO2-responsive transcriptional regulator
MSRASGPWRVSRAMASSTLPARSYSKGAGVCIVPPCLGPRRSLGGLVRLIMVSSKRAVNGSISIRLSRPVPGEAGGARPWGDMTLTQLEAFVLVARLGSVTAAARALGVSEPAVSSALSALRQQMGDQLISKGSNGMVLTPGGQRFVPIASQIVGLAAEGHAVIRQAQGAPARLRVAATSRVAEFVAPPLMAAFFARNPSIETSVGVVESGEMPALLHDRLADVCFGPHLSGESAVGLTSDPMMRYGLTVVASPTHRLAGRPGVRWPELVGEDWLVDPSGMDPSSEIGLLMAQLHVPPDRVQVFPNQAAAWSAASLGSGVAPAIAHLAARDIERGALCRLDVVSTPVQLLWYASALVPDRRSPAVATLMRFLTTPEAMQAMHRSDGAVPASRFRPPVYVTLWS